MGMQRLVFWELDCLLTMQSIGKVWEAREAFLQKLKEVVEQLGGASYIVREVGDEEWVGGFCLWRKTRPDYVRLRESSGRLRMSNIPKDASPVYWEPNPKTREGQQLRDDVVRPIPGLSHVKRVLGVPHSCPAVVVEVKALSRWFVCTAAGLDLTGKAHRISDMDAEAIGLPRLMEMM